MKGKISKLKRAFVAIVNKAGGLSQRLSQNWIVSEFNRYLCPQCYFSTAKLNIIQSIKCFEKENERIFQSNIPLLHSIQGKPDEPMIQDGTFVAYCLKHEQHPPLVESKLVMVFFVVTRPYLSQNV